MNPENMDLAALMRYFWVLAYAAVIGIAYLLGKVAMRKRLNRLREIAPFLGGQAVSGFLGPRVEGVKGGRKFNVAVVSGGRNAPPVIRLSMESLLPVDFSIQRPDTLAGVRNLFLEPVPTGDAGFDEKFSSYSPEPGPFAAFFSDHRRRDSARRLLERGYMSIVSKKGRASADMPAPDLEAELEPGRIGGALDDLASLST
ncbi:MAG TPA: hypothetical protein PKK31_03740 [Elusimicrobiales bacterium]|nr:hypothetical protein [Elusimicrobiales bacterium]